MRITLFSHAHPFLMRITLFSHAHHTIQPRTPHSSCASHYSATHITLFSHAHPIAHAHVTIQLTKPYPPPAQVRLYYSPDDYRRATHVLWGSCYDPELTSAACHRPSSSDRRPALAGGGPWAPCVGHMTCLACAATCGLTGAATIWIMAVQPCLQVRSLRCAALRCCCWLLVMGVECQTGWSGMTILYVC